MKIINDYKIDCEQFQINSSFYQEHQLWNHTTENVTWVLEDRKRFISPDEHNRYLDAGKVFAIGFELRDRGEGVTGEDLEDKTGFKWCAGTKLEPQGVYWEQGEGFIIVEGYSRYNRFEIKLKNKINDFQAVPLHSKGIKKLLIWKKSLSDFRKNEKQHRELRQFYIFILSRKGQSLKIIFSLFFSTFVKAANILQLIKLYRLR